MILLATIYVSGLIALIIAFLKMFRIYNKFIVPYKQFPWSFSLLKALPHFITGWLPKDTTRSSYIFQLAINGCRKHFSEGCCVVWIPKPHLFVYNEEFVKIFSNEQAALNKGDQYHVLRDGLGSGLGTSDAELWRKRRKLLQPVFHMSVLKSFIPTFNRNSSILVQQLKNEATEEPVDIIRFLKTCSFSNVLATVFGLKPENRLSKSEEERILELVDTVSDLMAHTMVSPFLQWKFWRPLFPIGRKFKKSVNEAKAVGEEILQRIKKTVIKENAEKAVADDPEYFSSQRKSLAEIIMQTHVQDPSFTMEDMNDETNTLLTSGYDTVAHAMMWCLFLLGHHPHVQEQVYDEVEYLAGKEITYEDLQSLTYTECVLKETLRLYPTIPLYARLLEKDIQCGKYTIPKGTNLVVFIYLLHRNPEIHSNPSEFDPERFRSNAEMNHRGYRPFSEGIRNCIGKQYAMIQMKITLAYILQNFKVTSLQRVEDIQGVWEIVLTPSKKVWLQLTPR